MGELQAPSGTQPVRVVGALSGIVYVPISGEHGGLVGDLRKEVLRLGGVEAHEVHTKSVKLIVGGRTLADDSKPLQACGVGPTAKVLVAGLGQAAGTSAGQNAVNQEEARAAQLEKIKRVMGNLAARDANMDDGQAVVLENQAGQAVQLSSTDRTAIVSGLALHDLGKAAMEKKDWPDALAKLSLAEESFAVATPSVLELVDNVGLLLLDLVWVCFKLGDVRRLSVASAKLSRARTLLERAHGPGLERLRALQGGVVRPELALYVRLETLEGVVAYLSGELEGAEKALGTAHRKWKALQVSDEQLALLQGMGFRRQEATRALRFSGGDVGAAVTFIEQQRAADQERYQRQLRDHSWRKERRKYGRTGAGAYVEQDKLDKLCELGYDRHVAAEALRSSGNEWSTALESLLDQNKRTALTLAASLRQVMPQDEPKSAKSSSSTKRARTAAQAGSSGAGGASSSAAASSTAQGAGGSGDAAMTADEATAATLQAEEYGVQQGQGGDEGHEGNQEEEEQRSRSDEELEEQVRTQLRSDPYQSYDIDVRDEGDVIQTYMALIHSMRAGNQGQQSGR